MLWIRGRMRCVGSAGSVYRNFCPTLYSFLWSNNEQRFEAACQLFCCCCCSKLDGRIGVDFYITEVVLEFIVSFAFLTLFLYLQMGEGSAINKTV